MSTFATRLIQFYKELPVPLHLPRGISLLYPYENPEVMKVTRLFFRKYFNDSSPRRLIFGINPGRFGAGITGINFTAPRQLKTNCGINHPFGNSSELSAEFIYQMIEAYGGPHKFYSDYFLTAVSPLGFIRNAKNINYYDDKKLQECLRPFITECLEIQLSFGFLTDHCFCIGGEKNFKFLVSLNEQRKKAGLPFFNKITPLPHPRFILQYRRKEVKKYIQLYLDLLC